MKKTLVPDPVQGEGDYAADQRYVKSARAFVKAGKVADAAGKAAPKTPAEQAELERAERSGLAHNKGEDPASPQAPSRKA